MTEQPDALWPRLEALIEREGPKAVIALAMSHRDPAERREMFSAAFRELSTRDWKGKNLDAILAVAQAGIWEWLHQADSATSPQFEELLGQADALSFGLASVVAPCWPGDDLPRTAAHHEAALSAAQDCLRWRAELESGPLAVALAHWARGIHLNALGRKGIALAAHESALHRAEAAAVAEGKPSRIAWNAHWLVLRSAGYVELSKRMNGSHDIGPFEKVLKLLAEGADARPEEREELLSCAAQLREAERRLLKR